MNYSVNNLMTDEYMSAFISIYLI